MIRDFLQENKTERFQVNSNQPHIVIVASIHGNEPSGYVGMTQLVNDFRDGKLRLRKGSLTVLPLLNPCGKKLGIRWLPQQMFQFHSVDGNRSYGKAVGEEGSCPITKMVESVIKNKTLVIDMHEGWGFHKRNPESMGSGVYYGQTFPSKKVATEMTSVLNQHIPHEDLQFVCKEWEDTPGTLRWYCDAHAIPYILIETSGQNNIQPIQVRANQQYTLALAALKQLQMI